VKLTALTLKIAIQEYKAADSPRGKSKVATKWFDKNAEITLEEIQKVIQ
jgi:hypothetical protein